MAGVVHIPWYATLFRGDKFEVALREIAPVALRYGATDFRVYRQQDDAYRFLQMATFDSHDQWDAYWYGEEFTRWRGDYTSWYQVPVQYTWSTLLVAGGMEDAGEEIEAVAAEQRV